MRDLRPVGDVHGRDRPGPRRSDHVEHLHRLDGEHRIAALDGLTGDDGHRGDDARNRAREACRSLRWAGAGAATRAGLAACAGEAAGCTFGGPVGFDIDQKRLVADARDHGPNARVFDFDLVGLAVRR